MKYSRILVTMFAFSICLASSAKASILGEWNLVVRNDLHTSSETDASALVGGDVLGTSNFSTQYVSAPNGDGLAVGGNIGSGITVNINNGGNLRISGSVLGTANINGGTMINDAGVSGMVTAAMNESISLSNYYLGLTPNGAMDGAGNFNAIPSLIGSDLVSVYNLNQTAFQALGQINLNIGATETVIINVGADANGLVDLIAPPNIIGGFSQANSNRILWNLYDATTVKVNNTFNGALLAPNADLQLSGGGINGSVVVDNVSQMDAEIRNHLFTGHTPEPTSLSLIGLGITVVLGRRSRRA